MARRHLASGGTANGSPGLIPRAESGTALSREPLVYSAGDFIVPQAIDPVLFAAAILCGVREHHASPPRPGIAPWPLELAADGRAFVPQARVVRIGVGSVRLGTGILNRLAADFRLRRFLEPRRNHGTLARPAIEVRRTRSDTR